MLPVIVGFASLSIDVGILYSTKADLQDAADAAALAGVSAYTTDAMWAIRTESQSADPALVEYYVQQEASALTAYNGSYGSVTTEFASGDILMGWIDVSSPTSEIQLNVLPTTFNAVQVTARRTSDSANGPIEFLFARVLGHATSDLSVRAVAVLDDRFSGYDTGAPGPVMWPLSMDVGEYQRRLVSSGDVFSFDEGSGAVIANSDGVREVNLYPSGQTPGNFGLLNIGIGSQSAAELAEQMTNGVTPGQFETETGSSELTFFDDAGNPTTYQVSGDPGLKVNLEDEMLAHVGEVVSIFIHDNASGSGSNTVYNIVGMRWGRVMHVDLSGGPSNQGVWIQPVSFSGTGVRTELLAPSSGGAVGRPTLVR